MSKVSPPSSDALRRRAEAVLARAMRDGAAAGSEDLLQLAQELAVHQAELELQNEELEEAQAALRDARDRLADLYENAPVGYVVLDAAGIVRRTNATYRAMVQRDDDPRGAPFAEALEDADAAVFLARFRAFFRNPGNKRIVVRMRRRDGLSFDACIEARPRREVWDDGQGDPQGEMLVIVSDVSELQQAYRQIEERNRQLEAAKAREERLNTILRAIRNVSQLITKEDDRDRLIQGVCSSLTQALSYAHAWVALFDQAGEAVVATAHAGSGRGLARLCERLEGGGRPRCMASALQQAGVVLIADPEAVCADCPAATGCSGQSSLVRRLHHGGRTFGVLGVSLPVAFARDAEEQALFQELSDDLSFALHKIEMAGHLAESRRRHAEIFQGSRDGFVVIRADGRIVDANQAYCDMLGYSLDELRALGTVEAITPARWHAWEAVEIRGNRLLKRGESGLFEKEYIRKDGTVFPAELRCYAVRDDAGNLQYIWGAARDITDRKRAEETIRQHAHRLAAVVDILQCRAGDLQGFLDHALDQAIALTGSKAGCVCLYDEDRQEFSLSTSSGDAAACAAPDPHARQGVDGAGSWREVVRQRRAILVNDGHSGEPPRQGQPGRPCGVQRFLTVPVFARERLVAAVRVASKESDYDETDALELTLLMDSAWKSAETIRAHAALRENERCLRAMLETTAEGFWLLDRDGRFVEVNEAYCALSGYARAEILRMRIGDVDDIESPAETAARMARIVAQGAELFETTHRRKDGSTWPVEVSSTYLDVRGGQFVCFCRDLTERRQREERIALLGRMLDEAPAAITIHDLRGRFLFANRIALALHGYSDASEFLQIDLRSLDLPESAALIRERMQRIGVEGEARFEVSHYRKDGTAFPLEVLAKMIEWQGEPAILSIATDITDRKRTEDELRRRENLLNRVFDVLPIGLWFADRNGTLQRGNRAGVRLWGAEPRAAVHEYGMFKAWRLPSREPVRAEDWALAKTVRDKVAILDELLEIEAFDGKRKTILNYSAPVLNDLGEIEAAIVVNLDISERVALENQLRQAQRMESIGRLAGGVAHDFNNMLGVIIGYTDMAIEEVDPASPLHADLLEVRRAARRSADITRQLLAFARKQTIAPRLIDLNETIEGMLKMLRHLIGEDIRLEWQPESGLWPVWMDPSQVDQILANLCVNARDAIAGVGTVSIATGRGTFDRAAAARHPECVPGDYVRLSVTDTGCGMDQATLDRLFEPFFTTKGVGKGTGLGLATVYGIVRQNNGFIEVASEVGKGTTITIHLQRHLAEGAPMQEECPNSDPLGHGEAILMVEDEKAILSLTRAMVEKLGYRVLAATSPSEALRLAREHLGQIALLITDVIMPEMNGRDLAEEITAIHPHLKVLFMSGYTADVIARHGVLDEGVHFIQKPFSKSQIATTIRRILDGA